jgi:S1-C subfamily serine protease
MTRTHRIVPVAAFATLVAALVAPAQQPDKVVLDAEAKRIAVISKVKPAVAAVCFYGGEACGSGVIIDPEGFALTNYHVVQPTGAVLQCGLPDGQLYDTVVVGQDKVGDVALIKLLPKKEGQPFPYVKLGDSDKVRVGEWSMAMGNPFGLSTDFTPTVTFGLVSGVNRYQPPEGRGTLEYTDCIQTDASINPGNSGGPLFNMDGELIGINGRIMFEKRVRINSGIGFAISVNQIKNFLGHMHAGIDTDHATLGAVVNTENEDGDLSRMIVGNMLEEADVTRRGVQQGDQLISFAGRPLTSTNQFKNILGIFPKEWRLPLTYRRGNEKKQVLVRLMGNMDVPVEQPMQPMPKGPMPKGPQPGDPKEKAKSSPAAKLFVEKKGFANYHFNKVRQEKLVGDFKKRYGDFADAPGRWEVTGSIQLADRQGEVKLILEENADGQTQVKLLRGTLDDTVTPLKEGQPLGELQLPQGSGGMLAALYQYRRLLTMGKAGFERVFDHGGHEPFYPPREQGPQPTELKDLRVDCEVLRTQHAAFEAKWFFDLKDGKLLGGESWVAKEEDPCELYFGDYKPVDGKQLPHRIEVKHRDKTYAVLTIKEYALGKK